jgi:flavin-dependent dehydrogenase
MERETDVLVVGACTAGLYFAGLMAKQGFKVLVCDSSSEENLGRRYDVIHIGQEYFKKYGLYESKPGDDEFVEIFHKSILRSALDKWPKNTSADIMVLRRIPLMKRLASWAREQGAEVLFDTAFAEPRLDESGRLCGAALSSGNGEKITVKARLVADASGIAAVVRTKLPAGYGVENFVTTARDQFYVVLQYVSLKHPEDKPKLSQTWPYYKAWIAPELRQDGAILGIGANLSFDYAMLCWKRFASRIKLPEHELEYIEQSSTPYRRPPYSFVADGFVVLGAAACIANPWSGEGVPYAWLHCSIAAEEFGKAMKNNAYPNREAVWQVNPRYQKMQGALFAQNLAMLSGAVNCSPEENDYEFEHSIIFEDEMETGQGNLIAKLLKGLFSGGLSFASLKNLVQAAVTGSNIFKHYQAYPQNPGGFDAWVKKADRLWSKARSMAELAEKDLASEKQP